MPKPTPLHGRLESVFVSLTLWRRRVRKQGCVTPDDAREVVNAIVVPARADLALLVKTQRFVVACLTGAEGMDSVEVGRLWERRQAEIAWEQTEDVPLDAATLNPDWLPAA